MTTKGDHKFAYSTVVKFEGKIDSLTTLKSLISPISSSRSELFSHRGRKCFFDDSENQENVNEINLKHCKRISVVASPCPLKRAYHENLNKASHSIEQNTDDATSLGKESTHHYTPKKLSGSFLSPPQENSSHKAARNLLMSAEKRRRELHEISSTSGNLLDNNLLKSAEKRNRELKEIAMCCNNILNYKYPLP